MQNTVDECNEDISSSTTSLDVPKNGQEKPKPVEVQPAAEQAIIIISPHNPILSASSGDVPPREKNDSPVQAGVDSPHTPEIGSGSENFVPNVHDLTIDHLPKEEQAESPAAAAVSGSENRRRNSFASAGETPSVQTAAPKSRFTRLRHHAEGGLGRVLLAHDEQLRREVALKEIRPDRSEDPVVRRRFITEAEITGQLEHPGVVPIYSLELGENGSPIYSMRFIQGHSYRDAIRAFHKQPSELGRRELLQRLITVCQTLAYAHRQDIIHRDLKPANIMVGDYGETLVVDWGLAKRLGASSLLNQTQWLQQPSEKNAATGHEPDDEHAKEKPSEEKSSAEQGNVPNKRSALAPAASENSDHTLDYAGAAGAAGAADAADAADENQERPAASSEEPMGAVPDTELTQAGQALGTPTHMAPEQARGDLDLVGPASDIYALGAILYEVLVGKPPYQGTSAIHVLEKVIAGPPPPPTGPHVTPALAAVIQKAMARAPQDRYATAALLARDLERWLADEPVSVFRDSWTVRCGRWARRHRTVVVSATVTWFLLLTVGTLTYWWRQEQLTEATKREWQARNRQSRNEDAVSALLDQCALALEADRADKATLALKAARERAVGGVSPALTQRLEHYDRDLQLLRELDRIDAWRWSGFGNERPAKNAAAAEWRQALRRFGVDFQASPLQQNADKIEQSLLKRRLFINLDSWLEMEKSPEIRDVLRRVDPDAVRDSLRDAMVANNTQQIHQRVQEPTVLKQPFHFLAALGHWSEVPIKRRGEILQAALNIRPGDLGVLMGLGDDAARQNRYRDSARWYMAAAITYPKNDGPLENLAYALHMDRDYDGAIVASKEALRANPHNALAAYNLGVTYLAKQDKEQAVHYFGESVRIGHNWPKAHSNLGYYVWKFQNKHDLGEKHARRALEIDPQFSEAYAVLGLIAASREQQAVAAEHYRTALRLSPDYVLVHEQLGALLEKQGDFEGAIHCFRNIIRITPDNVYYRDYLPKLERKQQFMVRLSKAASPEGLVIKNADEGVELAALCAEPFVRRFVLATRFYADAFAANPRLANDSALTHRYRAAHCAMLAGIGQGNDALALNSDQRGKLRQQALDWLRADLANWIDVAKTQPADQARVVTTLGAWFNEPVWRSTRLRSHRVGMPAAERAAWDQLWARARSFSRNTTP